MESLSPSLVSGPILEEQVIEVCSINYDMNLYLTSNGKVYCNGTNLKNIFSDQLFPNVPDIVIEPFLVDAIEPHYVTKLIPYCGLQPKAAAFLFKTDKGQCFAIGSNYGNRFGDNNVPINEIVIPEFESPPLDDHNERISASPTTEPINESDFALSEEEDESHENKYSPHEIMDATIFANAAWYLTREGVVYQFGAIEYSRYGLPKVVKFETTNLTGRGNNSKLYALCENGQVYKFDQIDQWQEMGTKDMLIKSKPYRHLSTMTSLIRSGFFAHRDEVILQNQSSTNSPDLFTG
jgi:hypothetical protein